MKRVASLYLPQLSIERLRQSGLAPQPSPSTQRSGDTGWLPAARIPENTKERARLVALRERLEQEEEGSRIEDCSCPRGGGWRPGASWASRDQRQAQIDALPAHQRPPMRMLGRRSEAARTPFQPSRERWIDPQPAAALRPCSPLVTTHPAGQRIVLAAVSREAAALGLQPGMPLTQARALVPGLEVCAADPQADLALLARLAVFAARRWTPGAAVSGSDGLWLDLGGVAHLFGGEQRMCKRILRFCARLGFDARIAVAGTPGAAHALARFARGAIHLCRNGEEAAAIAALPPSALRLDARAIAAARRFGIESVGELIAMPRGPLARRFGTALLTRLDQAIGRIEEPIEPIVPKEAPQVRLRFFEPILSAEAIEAVLADLTRLLATRLEQDQLGARSLILICERVDGEEQRLGLGLAGASRDSRHLLQLLRMKVEEVEPGFGIEAMQLIAGRCDPLGPQQIGSSEPAAALPPLIDRIAGRLGPGRIFRCSAIESDVPERSVCHVPALESTKPWPRDWPRPIRLLRRPERVDKVIAELPDQPPLRFWWRGEMHVVRKADGPERIHGEWWKRAKESAAVRDYFQVEDEKGARFWLFRRGDGVDPRTGDLSWYIHGVFA